MVCRRNFELVRRKCEALVLVIIVPIHKSGDKNDPDTYRGLSLLSILGKVFAHILNKLLVARGKQDCCRAKWF